MAQGGADLWAKNLGGGDRKIKNLRLVGCMASSGKPEICETLFKKNTTKTPLPEVCVLLVCQLDTFSNYIHCMQRYVKGQCRV